MSVRLQWVLISRRATSLRLPPVEFGGDSGGEIGVQAGTASWQRRQLLVAHKE